MAQPRKPSAILERNGAFAKNPDRARARANEPKDMIPLGPPSDTLTEEETETWHELVQEAPAGVVTEADRRIMEVLTVLAIRLRKRELDVAGMTQFVKFLGLLGMTPADRSRVTATPQKAENKFSKRAS